MNEKLSRGAQSMLPWTLNEEEYAWIEQARKEGRARPKIKLKPIPTKETMNYDKALDEYTTQELVDELDRRTDMLERGYCSYCNRSGASPSCKMTKRHEAASIQFARLKNEPTSQTAG